MYEFIEGKISELAPAYTVINCNGIGFYVNISLNTYSAMQEQSNACLYIHQVIKDDSHTLFGFFDKNERIIFRLLISVSGIGSNTARMMLSSLSPLEIETAILSEDIALIKSIKGIGLKTAQRVIIELKDKIGKSNESGEVLPIANNSIKQEALSALIALGFAKKNIEKTLDKIVKTEPNIKIEDLVKKALKMM